MIIHSYRDQKEVKLLKELYNFKNCRTWPYYPIVMPLLEGQGPASDKECDEITWEVWDRFCISMNSFSNLPDAIDYAIMLNEDLFK